MNVHVHVLFSDTLYLPTQAQPSRIFPAVLDNLIPWVPCSLVHEESNVREGKEIELEIALFLTTKDDISFKEIS